MSGGPDDYGLHLRQYRRMTVLTIEDSRSIQVRIKCNVKGSGRGRPLYTNLVRIRMRKVGGDATIKIPDDHLYDHSYCQYTGDDPGARPYSGRIRKNQTTARRTRTHADRTWHLQRDVERALLL